MLFLFYICFFCIFSPSYNLSWILFESRLAVPFATDFSLSVCYKNIVIAEGTKNPTENCTSPSTTGFILNLVSVPSLGCQYGKAACYPELERSRGWGWFREWCCEPAHQRSGCLSQLRALQPGEHWGQRSLLCSRMVHFPYEGSRLCVQPAIHSRQALHLERNWSNRSIFVLSESHFQYRYAHWDQTLVNISSLQRGSELSRWEFRINQCLLSAKFVTAWNNCY